MSALWKVEVLNKGNDWVDMELLFAHPDAGLFPVDPNFALQLLTCQAYGDDENYDNQIPICPLGDKVPIDKSSLPDDLSVHVDDIIKKIVVYKAKRVPFDESAVHEYIDAKVKELGIYEDSVEWDVTWEDFWTWYWSDPEHLPAARYRITVTDPKWIEHLYIGLQFDSAAFSQDGPYVEEDIDKKIKTPADAGARDKIDGFEGSQIPPRKSTMDMETIRSMAECGKTLDREAMDIILDSHRLFLESGGSYGKWNILQLSGIPMNVYSNKGKNGEQIVIRSTNIAKKTDLTETNISYADLSGLIAEKVKFDNSKLDGSMMSNSFFAGSSFKGASLVGADFTESDLQGVSFKDADLTNADFEICNLKGADFRGAKIEGASFKGANLKGIKR